MVTGMDDKGMADGDARASGTISTHQPHHFVIYHDSRDLYYVRLGLGVFWECASNIGQAFVFKSRARAADVLIKNGKHREGWRVIPL